MAARPGRDRAPVPALYSDQYSAHGSERQGFVLLTPAQRAAWRPATDLLGTLAGNSAFTSAHIEQLLALYQRLGIMAGLSATELRNGRRQMLRANIDSYGELLYHFPRWLLSTGGEDAEEPQAYARALRDAAACSRGRFARCAFATASPGKWAPPAVGAFLHLQLPELLGRALTPTWAGWILGS